MQTMLRVALALPMFLVFTGCQPTSNSETSAPMETVADKPFVSDGKITVDLDGGSYEVKTASDNHIRVAITGGTSAKADVTITGTQAEVKIKDTPHSNFHATVEIPAKADIVVRLGGGDLAIAAITGNKDVESYAGNVRIAVGSPTDYARVDAAVKAGDLDARPFGGSKSGLMQEFTWSGNGKYTLRAHLGAGNLELAGQ